MKKKVKLPICILIVVVLLIAGFITFSSSNTYKKSANEECKKIEKEDIELKIPKIFLESFETVDAIDDSLSSTQTYMAEDSSMYCLFNMDSFLIYLFIDDGEQELDVEGYEGLFYDRGIRVTLDADSVISGSDANSKEKVIFDYVPCEAVMSQEIYEDFTGKAAVIKDTYRNIGVYVGAKGRNMELDKDMELIMDDIVYSLTSTKTGEQQIIEYLSITESLKQGADGRVSYIDSQGQLNATDITDVTILDKKNADSLLKKITEDEKNKKAFETPEGYDWKFIRVKGSSDLNMLNIKVKDERGNVFDTGSRTYTVSISEKERTDAYLVPTGTTCYMIEIGDCEQISTLIVGDKMNEKQE